MTILRRRAQGSGRRTNRGRGGSARFGQLAVPSRWAGIALTVVVLAACGTSGGGGGGGAGNSGGTVTLNFLNAQDPGTFDKVIAAFEKANPTIKIKQQVVPFDDLNTSVQSRLSSKDSTIDLFDVDEPRLAAFAARGFLLDIGDLRQQAEGKIDSSALDITSYQGKQYAMPRWTSSQVLYYNKALLTKAHVPAPSDPKTPMTWEDISTNGKKVQRGGVKWGFSFDQVDRYYQLQPLPESLGAGPGLTGQGLLTPDITNAGWIKAFDWYASTFKTGLSPRGVSPEQTATLFAAAKTPYFAGGPWNASLFDKTPGLDYGVSAFPMFAGGKPASSTDSWSTGISPFSKQQQAAKKFLAYMTIDATGAAQASSNNTPVQKEAFKTYLADLRAKGPRSAQLADVVENDLRTAVHRPRTTGYVDFETVMNKAFADIRNGSDPAQRLHQASDELNRVLAKYR